MSVLLGIDTATEACSVALGIGDECRETYEVIPRQHSQKVLPMVDLLLAEAGLKKADIDAIAFGCGPGSFTGVRIATAITQGLAFALDKPVIPVSTLAALAQQAVRIHDARHVLAAIDARMGELYWGAFTKNEGTEPHIICISEEQLSVPEEIRLPVTASEDEFLGIGSGWHYADRIPESVSLYNTEALPHAMDILSLARPLYASGKTVSADQVMPVYLRNNVARKKKKPAI